MEQQNKKPITLASLFDGSGGFPLGGVLAGIKYYSGLSCTCQQILDTKYQKIVSYTVRLYKPYATLDIAPRNAGQVMPTV